MEKIKLKTTVILLVLSFLILTSGDAYALPAFPGAEGAGANSLGGRGGAVIKVTNLNDSGTGSFRAACTASGARIVVFEVSGWITLNSPVVITSGYITIAGQTSPGGVGIRGDQLRVNAGNVIITHMRFAAGSFNGDGKDSFSIWGNNQSQTNPAASSDVANIILDHCSFRWGCDECGEMSYNPNNITVSWSIVGPGLYNCTDESNHNLGWLNWGKYSSSNMTYSMHHNLFIHNRYRDPEHQYGLLDGWNNIIFDYYGAIGASTEGTSGAKINWRHNYCKKSSATNASPSGRELCLMYPGTASPVIYVDGNIGCYRTSQSQNNWDSVEEQWSGNSPSTAWQRSSAWPISVGVAPTITTMSASYADQILNTVGAYKPVRDSLDVQYIANFKNGTHAYYDGDTTGNETADYPSLSGGTAPADTDNDGISDAWEIATWGSITPTASGDQDSDGYTNIEEYLHYLGGYGGSAPPSDTTPPAAPTGLRVQ